MLDCEWVGAERAKDEIGARLEMPESQGGCAVGWACLASPPVHVLSVVWFDVCSHGAIESRSGSSVNSRQVRSYGLGNQQRLRFDHPSHRLQRACVNSLESQIAFLLADLHARPQDELAPLHRGTAQAQRHEVPTAPTFHTATRRVRASELLVAVNDPPTSFPGYAV